MLVLNAIIITPKGHFKPTGLDIFPCHWHCDNRGLADGFFRHQPPFVALRVWLQNCGNMLNDTKGMKDVLKLVFCWERAVPFGSINNKDAFNIFTLNEWVKMCLNGVFPVITVDLVYRQAVKRSLSVKKTEWTLSVLKASSCIFNQSLRPILECRRFLHLVYSWAAFSGRLSLLKASNKPCIQLQDRTHAAVTVSAENGLMLRL